MFKGNRLIRVGIIVFGTALWGTQAHAYWTGSTPDDGIEIKASPGGRTLRTLPRGTSFNSADSPQQGYYRVRTSQETGWIQASQIESVHRGGSGRTASRGRSRGSSSGSKGAKGDYGWYNTRRYQTWAVTALGNLDFYTPTDLNNLINTSDFSGGFTYGAELQYNFNYKWSAGLRVEKLGKTIVGQDQTTGNTYNFALTSTSIAVGPEYTFFRDPSFTAGVAAYIGIAPTSFTSTATNITDQANVTQISASPIAFMLVVDGTYAVADHFSILGELGYRMLKTAALVPATIGAGGSIFANTAGYSINLSGPIAGLGLRFSF